MTELNKIKSLVINKPHLLAAVSLLQAGEDSSHLLNVRARPAIKNTLIRQAPRGAGLHFVATDGQRLAIAYDKKGELEMEGLGVMDDGKTPSIFMRIEGRNYNRLTRRDITRMVVHDPNHAILFKGKNGTIEQCDHEAELENVFAGTYKSDKFPPYEKYIPDLAKHHTSDDMLFAPDHLRDFSRFCEVAFDEDNDYAIKLTCTGGDDIPSVFMPNHPSLPAEWIYCIMNVCLKETAYPFEI